jgi:hypothetical protein
VEIPALEPAPRALRALHAPAELALTMPLSTAAPAAAVLAACMEHTRQPPASLLA